MPDDPSQDSKNLLIRLSALEKELAALKVENNFLKSELSHKNKVIEALQKRLFGSSSEKLDPKQLQLLFDAIVMGKPAPLPESNEEPAAPEKKINTLTRRTKADRFPKNLKILVEEIIIPEEVKANPEEWIEIGEEHHDELDITKSEFFWRRKTRKKFVHKEDKDRPPVIEPAPRPSIPGTHCAPDLAAQIITDKYQDHLPHYRQSQRFRRRHDVDIGRQTINGWTHAAAEFISPIDRAIRAEILQATALEIDETPIDYQAPGHGSVKEGRLWAYRDPVTGTCYFDWHAGRGAECLLEMLGYDEVTNTIDFNGSIHTDGYIVYDTVASRFGLRHGGCLAHVRRKFTDLGKASPEVTVPILIFIQQIYVIERKIDHATTSPHSRELTRRDEILPIANKLHQFILDHLNEHLPSEDVRKALQYTLNQWSKIIHCLSQGVLEIDTNRVENMIRPTKLGMKNWMFFGSLEAGKNNAIFYTILSNCRAQGLNPEDYLAEVFKRLPHNASAE